MSINQELAALMLNSSNVSTMSMDGLTLLNSNSSTWSTLCENAGANESKYRMDLNTVDKKPFSKHEFTEFWINLVQEQQNMEEEDNIDAATKTENWFVHKYFEGDDSEETTKELEPETDDIDMDGLQDLPSPDVPIENNLTNIEK